MSSAEKIKHLKLIIGAVDVTLPREAWPAPGLDEGVPKGCVARPAKPVVVKPGVGAPGVVPWV